MFMDIYKTLQKGSVDSDGVVALFSIGFFVLGGLWLFGFNFGQVDEGVVKYEDCRQIIELSSGDWQSYFHSFTCSTYKSKKGVPLGGECVSIKNDGSLFSSSHSCSVAYVYKIKPSNLCKGNIKDGVEYPYLGYDDQCYATLQ